MDGVNRSPASRTDRWSSTQAQPPTITLHEWIRCCVGLQVSESPESWNGAEFLAMCAEFFLLCLMKENLSQRKQSLYKKWIDCYLLFRKKCSRLYSHERRAAGTGWIDEYFWRLGSLMWIVLNNKYDWA